MVIFKAWAPPLGLGWGKWIDLYEHAGNRSVKVSFDSESQAKSTFDIEIKESGRNMTKRYVGPTSVRVTSHDCYCITKVRFKSHTLGQNIRIEVK
ncbi:hypothetical protein CRV08_02735 [Halarcobacter ebronensis]|uniref:Uncharacterized protein n=1 Tax=Halarcobacter ebronensis TaxID=1462615 RepID=A0A4V1LRW7_9BACT|nr:colicin Z C-terminal domain-related protein [Halarcobacter ebronensis]RXJ69638.1 hypothetical protein CRV08_02735 [Halarcobacter ebronensis]